MATVYFQRLASRSRALADAGADAVSQPSMELIRAVISTHLDVTATAAKESLQVTLQLRILEYVRTHLGDPSLSAARIAAEHHISVRHLYNVLAGGGISLGEWIRSRRLEACRDELGRRLSQDVTIASVAQRWDFVTHRPFGRRFRSEYGLSPREWREMATKAQPAGAADSAPRPGTT